jgi:Lrp/AsnC family transcriptional regulator for asnA, asnC and gidA
MNLRIDVKDRKLLYYLASDAGMSAQQIARGVGLSRNAVAYRIARLREHGVISRFTAVINLSALGLDTFVLLLKLRDDVQSQPGTLATLREHPFVTWAVALAGEWDALVEFVCRDLRHLHEIVSSLRELLDEKLLAYEALLSHDVLRVEHLVADSYAGLGLEPLGQRPRARARIMTDAVDRMLLRAMSEDSAQSYVALSAGAGVGTDVVRYRLRRLAAEGVIVKRFADVAVRALGYAQYVCRISLRGPGVQDVARLSALLREDARITYAFLDTLSCAALFVCACKGQDDLDALLRSLRQGCGDAFDAQSYLLVREQIVFDLFPKGLLEDAPSQNSQR